MRSRQKSVSLADCSIYFVQLIVYLVVWFFLSLPCSQLLRGSDGSCRPFTYVIERWDYKSTSEIIKSWHLHIPLESTFPFFYFFFLLFYLMLQFQVNNNSIIIAFTQIKKVLEQEWLGTRKTTTGVIATVGIREKICLFNKWLLWTHWTEILKSKWVITKHIKIVRRGWKQETNTQLNYFVIQFWYMFIDSESDWVALRKGLWELVFSAAFYCLLQVFILNTYP